MKVNVCVCFQSIQSCPFDSTPIERKFPENEAILALVQLNGCPNGSHSAQQQHNSRPNDRSTVGQSYDCVEIKDIPYFRKCVDCIKQMAFLLRPQHQSQALSRPMQRKLITLLHCQVVEGECRTRALRNARSIGERALGELLVKHQDSHQLSSNLWAAVRARGCQFLGPAMQEEVLRLVLLALEDGSALSRKVLVMFVVQRLSPHFPHQASKTAIGHVIQLLYRASCFKLTKRDSDSSLMQLKEEYCSYEALRREHDTQIVSIALEAGLRISPDQWSSLLYGDSHHKSHMQSIIDKLQSPASFAQSIQEFIIALQRTGDPCGLVAIKQPLERLAIVDPNPLTVTHPTLEELGDALECAKVVIFQLIEFLQRFGSSHNNLSNNNINRNKLITNITQNSNQRQRVNRVRPLIDEQSISRQLSSEPFPSMNVLSPTAARHPSIPTVIRPCVSVQPSRIIGATNLMVSPTLAMSPHSLLSATPGDSDIGAVDSSFEPHLNTLSSISLPVLVTTTASHTLIQNTPPIGASLLTCGTNTTTIPPSLPSEDDQIIPFSDRPFVSKYGPVRSKYGVNLINTPTMTGLGNGMSQQMTVPGTHPTNVILGRSAVPSLTLIQPLQILTTTFLTDPNSNSQYGRTFIPDPTYQSTYVSGLMDLETGDN
ncbi:roquin-2-like [Oppia nitens]|uniref:roquin-2-like n=1 Tax=Oppia nitens TaxID=1686743 RepID=UPI0023DCC0A0|nr:roquin-2-like [Oppia nitens]